MSSQLRSILSTGGDQKDTTITPSQQSYDVEVPSIDDHAPEDIPVVPEAGE